MNKEEEIVEFSYNFTLGNHIKDIYYEREIEKAIMFRRKSDNKIIWIPKSSIKGAWHRDKEKLQNIGVRFPIKLYWKLRKNYFYQIMT